MTRLLVLLLGDASREQLEAAVEPADDETSVYLVAPSRVGPLEWLATDETRAQGEAAARVLEAEWLLAGVAETEGGAGESDPVVAVADALERFPADEIVIAGSGEIDTGLLDSLRSFGLPVRASGVSVVPVTARTRARGFARSLRSGRSPATPFVALVAANLGLLAIAIVGALLVALVVWLITTV